MGLFPFLSGYSKPVMVKVTTMDADLDNIQIDPDWTGRTLFDTVCRIIGLREIWYFGLQFTNKKGLPCWLQMDKSIMKQDVPKVSGVMNLLFLVKFYPEDVEEELIQDLTRHLFFLQIKQAILSMDLYCSAEASVLLASFAVQAMHGDCRSSNEMELELARLLPSAVIESFDMTPNMWAERIRRWWNNNNGQTKEDAEMEYLRVAQDLEMYGIQYYPISNKKETDLHVGISAHGIGIYKGANRITPRPFFSWSEIKHIQFKNKQFEMRTVEGSTIWFRACEPLMNMSILDLCIGTHNLYLRRRQPDLLEVQQMKAQAKEQRERRQAELLALSRERECRLAAEQEQERLTHQLQLMQQQLHAAKETVRKTEETAEQLAEKARASEQGALDYAQRAREAEAECHRLKINSMKSEEARVRLERASREADMFAGRRLSQPGGGISIGGGGGGGAMSDRGRQYSSHAAIVNAAEQGSWPMSVSVHGTLSHHQLMSSGEERVGGGEGQAKMPPPSYDMRPPPQHQVNTSEPVLPPELVSIRQELERTRQEYEEKQRRFRQRLTQFRQEVEGLKREGAVGREWTENEEASIANRERGADSKYASIRIGLNGSTKQRVQTAHELLN